MMGGQHHPLRKHPLLKALSKHGDSFDLKELLATSKSVNVKIEEFPTDLNISGLRDSDEINKEGQKFFSFIYNYDFEQFTKQQKAALQSTITEIYKMGQGVAHPTHEIIWVKRI